MPTSPKRLVNVNGQVFSEHEARISVFDRGFLFGDSIYEVTQTIEGVPFMLDDHLDRLYRSGEKIALQLPYSRDELKKELARVLKALAVEQAYVRIIITRGEGEIGLDPGLATSANLVIIAKELPPYPRHWYTEGVDVIVAHTLRNPTESIDPNVKSGNYLNNVMAFAEASRLKAFDALMLNHRGEVTEGTTSNVWIVNEQGLLKTPPLASGLLEGITRKHLLEICREQKIEVSLTPIHLEELQKAQEIFLTSSTKRLVPLRTLDGKAVGSGSPGPIWRQLSTAYDAHVQKIQAQAREQWQAVNP
jgi:branched-chain amino acid aminotransferase